MLNYLIAIVTTVYEDNIESGDFVFKSNKYMYIERFMIPLENDTYSQLVMHPPPLNLISSMLLLCVWKKKYIERWSKVINKLIFWLENFFYIFYMFLYELMLVPFIYLRLVFQIIAVAEFLDAFSKICIWLMIGLFFLIYNLVIDMFYYFKILCDYKEEEGATVSKVEQDEI